MIVLVYVAGPFSASTREGVEANIARAVALSIEVAKLGAMPVCPHANTAHPNFEHVQPYEFWLNGTAEILRRCDASIFTPDWVFSNGARSEQELAINIGVPCFYSLDRLKVWLEAASPGLVRSQLANRAGAGR